MKNVLALFALLAVSTMAPTGAGAARELACTARVDRDTVTVGDRVRLRLRIEREPGDALEVIPDVRLPEALRVIETGPATTEPLPDGRVRVEQTFVLTSFRTGSFEIPPAVARIVRIPGDTASVSSRPLSLFVRSVLPEEGAEDIRDVKAPLALRPRIPAWAWALLAAALAGLVAFLVWRLRRRRRTAPEPPAPPPDWFEEMRRLAASSLPDRGAFSLYYTQLSEAFRRFLEMRTGVEAMERTTVEIGRDLSATGAGGRFADEAAALLSEADLVKFAKSVPSPQKARDDAARALDLMARIDAEWREEEAAPAAEPVEAGGG